MAQDVEVNVKVPYGMKGQFKALKLTKAEINKHINHCLRESCRYIRDYARKHHRDPNDPTNKSYDDWDRYGKAHNGLTRAIRFGIIKKAQLGEVYVRDSEVPYAKYQLQGHRKQKIKAKNFPYMTFQTRDGKWHRRKWVHGIRGYDALGNAYKKSKIEVKDIFREGLRRLLNGDTSISKLF